MKTAKNYCEATHGLMNTKKINADGMLFYFNNEDFLSFWMKNTEIPLDIGFFNKDYNM